MDKPLWKPSKDRIKNAEMTRFMAFLKKARGLLFHGYHPLWQWSVEDRAGFWQSIWEFFDVKASRKWDEVLVNPADMVESRWFAGARLNFAENLLRHAPSDREALVFVSENGSSKRITFSELLALVSKAAAALKAEGVKAGDRVAAFTPNLPETVVAMLASASIGAIWSSCSPDFGINGVFDRFSQIEPKVLFTADGYFYNGKQFDSLAKAAEIAAKIPSIRKVVVIPYAREIPDTGAVPGSVRFGDFLGSGPAPEPAFEQLPFDHPVYILYSSGTTGVPKCIVHGAGGTLLQHMKELALHIDVKKGDRVFYYTTTGWMMWNWLVSSLALGATVLLFDGNPFHPDEKTLWRLADAEKMTVFGTSARYLASLEKTGFKPREQSGLAPLRAVCSTGSPLAPDGFRYVYRDVKKDVQLASIAGGTDLISCFGLGNPIGPVYESELQVRGLGMDVDVWNPEGKPIVGEQGELVCKSSFPSQPVFFWNDPGKKKYRDTYFTFFPGIWRHGDFVELTPHGGLIFTGRSDATLKPGGVRIGTSEIYRQIESLDEIQDSIVIDQEWEGDVRIILFVVLKKGLALTADLVAKIRATIRTNATPRHVPAKIIAVPDIPRTISGKKVEIAVRKIVHGSEVQNRDALANPESLEYFRNITDLKT